LVGWLVGWFRLFNAAEVILHHCDESMVFWERQVEKAFLAHLKILLKDFPRTTNFTWDK
jgi:hypothetical protein